MRQKNTKGIRKKGETDYSDIKDRMHKPFNNK